MRITQGMLARNSLRQITQSYEKLERYQNELSTGKKFFRPSDDPAVALKGMTYRTNLTEVEQYERNIAEAYRWMDNSESSLEQANSVLQRMRELVVQAKNDTNNLENRQVIAKEIEQLKQDLVQTANAKTAGHYLFNGTDIARPPVAYNHDGGIPTVSSNSEPFNIMLSEGIALQANINPAAVFSQELFNTVSEIQGKLNDGKSSEQLDGLLEKLDGHLTNLSSERSDLGARYNRLQLIEERVSFQKETASRMISDNEDVELEQVIVKLTTQESVHRAALSVGAKIIQPTLLDFLR